MTPPAGGIQPEPIPDDSDEALRPISVRLGTVVPPEDPEDWRRPLTWVAAGGMLLAPTLALLWFVVAPPVEPAKPLPGTWLIAGALVIGGVLTGTTQLRPGWAFAGTLGSALFGALLTILYAVAVSPQPRAGIASPFVEQVLAGCVAGLAGALAAATLMPTFTRMRSRARRGLAPAAIGIAVSAVVVRLILSA